MTVTGVLRAGTPATEPFVVAPVSGDMFASDVPASSLSSPSVVVSPNPFSGRTALRFSLASASPVRLSVHDVLGREVAVLADGPHAPGRYEVAFYGSRLAAGLYVVRAMVETGGSRRSFVERITLLR